MFEGGINTPFIAYRPKGGLQNGSINSFPAHVTDIMATCVEISGAEYPKYYQGNAITPTLGKSILAIPRGTAQSDTQETIFWEHFGSNAIRKGNWKLVKLDNKSPWELYNLSND